MIRTAALVSLLGLVAACDVAPSAGPAGIDRAVAAGAPQAYYADFPSQLFLAHEQVCTRPSEKFVRISATEIRCEMLLPPEMTGGLILEFDGTVEDLPRLIMAFYAQAATEGGWLVTSDSFIRIPQREGGGVREVRLPDPELRATLTELFRLSGGRPL